MLHPKINRVLIKDWTFCTVSGQHILDVVPVEWIEFVPAPGPVERDGELWWRHDDGVTVHWTQITKSQDPRRTS